MTVREWERVRQYVPERAPEEIGFGDRHAMFHELVLSFADVSEQAIAAERRNRNKALLLGLSDACDQLIAGVLDLLREVGTSLEIVRVLLHSEQARTIETHGSPAERRERFADFVLVLAEELGEVAEAIQSEGDWSNGGVVFELVQVASVALTMRRAAVSRSGVNW